MVKMATTDSLVLQAGVQLILQGIGEDATRDGLIETPARAAKAWMELTSGYAKKPEDCFKSFDGDGYTGIILLGPVTFFSTCEHHLLPFFGKAWVAYKPSSRTKRILGLSKLARLVDIFARRLQVQERLTRQVAETLLTLPDADGAACLIEAQHLCMMARGVGQQEAHMTTLETLGCMSEQALKTEFLSYCRR